MGGGRKREGESKQEGNGRKFLREGKMGTIFVGEARAAPRREEGDRDVLGRERVSQLLATFKHL